MLKNGNLIIAPHPDDEVLGCSSALEGAFVYYCGIDETMLPQEIQKTRIDKSGRLEEIERVSKFMGFRYEINPISKINNYKMIDFIPEIERLINKLEPDKVFIPFHCYNQDHQAIYDACQVALRPHDRNFFVKKVLVYEQAHVAMWERKHVSVNYFVKLDILTKLHAYNLHKSQVRGMRSPEILEALARLRGASINVPYAEAFVIERWVE
jgi:N-acetylglucosamine malate deacetylase 1